MTHIARSAGLITAWSVTSSLARKEGSRTTMTRLEGIIRGITKTQEGIRIQGSFRLLRHLSRGRVKRRERRKARYRLRRLEVLHLRGDRSHLKRLRRLLPLRRLMRLGHSSSLVTTKAPKHASKHISRLKPLTTRVFLGTSIRIGTAKSTGCGRCSTIVYCARIRGRVQPNTERHA